jgi:hypothetical protein
VRPCLRTPGAGLDRFICLLAWVGMKSVWVLALLAAFLVSCRPSDLRSSGPTAILAGSSAEPTPVPSLVSPLTLPPSECPYEPEGGFMDVWRNEQVSPRLGCAVGPAERVTGTEVYLCDGTHSLWLIERRLFFVIPVWPGSWALVPDESNLTPDIPLMDEPVPRSEPCFPVTGRHRWVARSQSSQTVPRLSARTGETPFTGVTQRFEGGWLLWNGNVCLVLFADGTWTMF